MYYEAIYIQYCLVRQTKCPPMCIMSQSLFAKYTAYMVYIIIYVISICVYFLPTVSCDPLLETPKNGKRVVITTNGFAKHISFSCNLSYVMMGMNLATCNNGTWSSHTPKCMQ